MQPEKISETSASTSANRTRQQALARDGSEARLAAMFAHAPIGMARVDPAGHCLEANTAFCGLLGYTGAELRRTTLVELTHPDDRATTLELVRQLLAGERPSYELEKRYLHADGRAVWTHVASSPVRSPTGEHLYTIVQIHDISEKKRTEAALVESEGRNRQVVMSAIDAVVAMDAAGHITGWNRQAECVFGWSEEEALGSCLVDMIVPAGLREGHRRGVARYLETREARLLNRRIEITALTRAGLEIPVELSITPIRVGEELHFSAFLRDISDSKRAREQLRETTEQLEALIEALPLGVIATDAEGNVRTWNPAAERIFGWTAAEVVGKPPPHLPPSDKSNIQQSVELGETVRGREERRRRRDGSLVEVHVSRAGLAGAASTRAAVGIFEDVTERKGIERELARAREAELERLALAALTDHLTGLRNHRAFHEELERELARRERNQAALSLVMLDLAGLKRVNDTLGHAAGDERLKALAVCLRATLRAGDAAYRIGGDEFALVFPGEHAWGALRLVQRLGERLREENGPRLAVAAGIAEATGQVPRDTLVRQADLALIAAKRSKRGALIYSIDQEPAVGQLDPGSDRHYLQTLTTALARAVDAKDSYTRSHCETVAELCALIAGELGLAPERIGKLRLAGLLHDVGKIGIPDAVLQKPEPLTREEFEIMKTHAALGCRIVSGASLDEQAGWILHHHERPDGRGYPDGVVGEEVPLESQIMLVADAFEAITSDRPYREGRSDAAAFEELERHAGTQFDPGCVAALRRALEPSPLRLVENALD